MAETKTPAEKAAETRKRHKAERKERERNRKAMVKALERIIQDDRCTWEATQSALFLLAEIYRR